MFDEEDLIPLSALQHLVFCQRRCALVHLEQIWVPNRYTVEGDHLHNRVDEAGVERRPDVVISRGLPIRSLRLGLSGRADVVEFYPCEIGEGIEMPGRAGSFAAFPVEYKRGTAKRGECDEIQLCAQALCLEEMLGSPVRRGAVFYATPRRRLEIELDARLRENTENYIDVLRRLWEGGKTPAAEYSKKCESCSMLDVCLPTVTGNAKAPTAYWKREMDRSRKET